MDWIVPDKYREKPQGDLNNNENKIIGSSPSESNLICRYYVSYTGISLPLKLITPIEGEDLGRRITYFRGYYNDQDQLIALEKVVYGEVEFEHRYQYYPDGRLKSTELLESDESPRIMQFE
jgi:hypothetical protein